MRNRVSSASPLDERRHRGDARETPDSSLRFIDIKTLCLENPRLYSRGVCFSSDELINSIALSGLHLTLRVPARPEPEGSYRLG